MAHRPSSVNIPRLAALLALCLMGGCSGLMERLGPDPIPRGNPIDPERLAQITPGMQDRLAVQSLLGSPTARGTFDDEYWYYISARSRLMPAAFLDITDRRVIAIAFDRRGVVREVQELTAADSRDIRMVARETPVPGNDRSLLQALFGNIGRPTLESGGAVSGTNPAALGVGRR